MEKLEFETIIKGIEGIDKITSSLKKLANTLNVEPYFYKVLLNSRTNKTIFNCDSLKESSLKQEEFRDYALLNSFNLAEHILKNTIFATGKSREIFTNWLWYGINSKNNKISNKYRKIIKENLDKSLAIGDHETTDFILSIKPVENPYYDDTKLLDLIKESFFLKDIPNIFIDNLTNGNGRVYHRLNTIYCAFFYDLEKTKSSKYSLSNMDKILDAAKICSNGSHEPTFALMMGNSFRSGEYSDEMKSTVDYIKKLNSIKDNQKNNTKFVSTISNDISGRTGRDKDLIDIVHFFEEDLVSNNDRLELFSHLYYNMTINNDTFSNYLDNELKPRNDTEKVRLLDLGILYRYRDNEKLKIVMNKFFSEIDYDYLLETIKEGTEGRVFRTSFKDIAESINEKNNALMFKKELEKNLNNKNNSNKKMKI